MRRHFTYSRTDHFRASTNRRMLHTTIIGGSSNTGQQDWILILVPNQTKPLQKVPTIHYSCSIAYCLKKTINSNLGSARCHVAPTKTNKNGTSAFRPTHERCGLHPPPRTAQPNAIGTPPPPLPPLPHRARKT